VPFSHAPSVRLVWLNCPSQPAQTNRKLAGPRETGRWLLWLRADLARRNSSRTTTTSAAPRATRTSGVRRIRICLTFDMSGRRKAAKLPFDCPLDGVVRRRPPHQACALLVRQHSASLCWRNTNTTYTAAGMGRRPMPSATKNERCTGAAYSQGRRTSTCAAEQHGLCVFAQPPRPHTASCSLLPRELAQRFALSWHLRGGAPPANGRAARHSARASCCAMNEQCADCQRTGGPARRRRQTRDAHCCDGRKTATHVGHGIGAA
jgi:hypothetical protein